MDNLGIITSIVLAATVAVLVAWLIGLTVSLKGHKGWHKSLIKALEKKELAEVVTGSVNDIASLGSHLEEIATVCDNRATEAEKAIQRVGLVRFDAFNDVGGELSFAAALLDDRGDGLVISAINGREQARCYAKPVTCGKSKYNLSEEEQQAIDEALNVSSRLKLAQGGKVRS